MMVDRHRVKGTQGGCGGVAGPDKQG